MKDLMMLIKSSPFAEVQSIIIYCKFQYETDLISKYLSDNNIQAMVIHYTLPESLEEYVQEIGRAGLDGRLSYCHLFFDDSAYFKLRSLTYSDGVDEYAVSRFLSEVFTNELDSHGKICSLVKEPASCKFDMKEEVMLTILTHLELGEVQYLRLLPQTNVTCTINFHQGSASASSSVDLGSARQTETRVQRQLSGKKSDIETYRSDINTKHQRTGSSLSGTWNQTSQGLGFVTGINEENFEVAVAHVENEVGGVTNVAPEEQLWDSESAGIDDTCTEVVCNNYDGTMVDPTSELLTNTLNVNSGDSSVASFSNVEVSASFGNGEDFQDARSISDREEHSTLEEDTLPNSVVDRVNVVEVPNQSSLDTISEIETENGHLGMPGSESDVGSPDTRSTIDELPEPSVATAFDKDITASVAEHDTLDGWN